MRVCVCLCVCCAPASKDGALQGWVRRRDGQNRVCAPEMFIVYLVMFLPKILYTHRIYRYVVLANHRYSNIRSVQCDKYDVKNESCMRRKNCITHPWYIEIGHQSLCLCDRLSIKQFATIDHSKTAKLHPRPHCRLGSSVQSLVATSLCAPYPQAKPSCRGIQFTSNAF